MTEAKTTVARYIAEWNMVYKFLTVARCSAGHRIRYCGLAVESGYKSMKLHVVQRTMTGP